MDVFSAGPYACLELFARQTAPGGRVILEGPDAALREETAGEGYFRRLRFPLEPGRTYRLALENAQVSLGYLTDAQTCWTGG